MFSKAHKMYRATRLFIHFSFVIICVLPKIGHTDSPFILQSHPLNGKIYAVKTNTFVSLAQLKQATITTPVILLGVFSKICG